MTDSVDVVVVGAGLAGLTAARELKRGGARVAVVEARDRVGGRTLSRELGGQQIDLGGQWIGPGQHRMQRLARELGTPTFPTYAKGRKILDVGGKISTYAGTIPKLLPHRLLLLNHAIGRVEKLRKGIPTEQPLRAAGAEQLDALSLASWQRIHVPSKVVRDILDVAVRVVFGAEAAELSLLHFLFYANAGGGLMHLVETENGAQQDRFFDGAQQVSIRLAEGLGERIHKGAPARRVEQESDGVTVHTDKGAFRGRYAILAVPPHLAGRIEFAPRLPAIRDGLTQRVGMGATIKCVATYASPFWRGQGLSGEAVCTGGPVTVVFDNSPRDGGRGALLAFVVGRHARALGARPAEERRRAVLDVLARLYGPSARDPMEYVEMDWSEEAWTGGCPTSTVPPGVLTSFGAALRAPIGRLHFAGTETATQYCGYMEGAIESGERAAREALARL